MKLYYANGTRANKVRWVLEELGVPYDLQRVDMKAGEHKAEAYRKVNPLGLIPALEVDGQVILESNAICLYLADRHPGLLPPPEHRGKYFQWCFFGPGTLETPFYQLFRQLKLLPEGERSAEEAAKQRKLALEGLQLVEDALTGDTLLPSGFSLADILISSLLGWAVGMDLLTDLPRCQAFLERCKGREARQRAYAD